MCLVADHEIPTTVWGGEFCLDVFIARQLVETCDGEVIRARRFVVSSLNPHQTFLDLLDEALVPREIRDRVNGFQYNLLAPLFALNLNLAILYVIASKLNCFSPV